MVVAFDNGLHGFAGCFGFVGGLHLGVCGVCGELMWIEVGADAMSPAGFGVGFFDIEGVPHDLRGCSRWSRQVNGACRR